MLSKLCVEIKMVERNKMTGGKGTRGSGENGGKVTYFCVTMLFFFSFSHFGAYRNLVPQVGIEPALLTMKA